jgi:hypothetical protein
MDIAWPWVIALRQQIRPTVRQRRDLRSTPPMRVKSLSIQHRLRTLAVVTVPWGIYSHPSLLDMLAR